MMTLDQFVAEVKRRPFSQRKAIFANLQHIVSEPVHGTVSYPDVFLVATMHDYDRALAQVERSSTSQPAEDPMEPADDEDGTRFTPDWWLGFRDAAEWATELDNDDPRMAPITISDEDVHTIAPIAAKASQSVAPFPYPYAATRAALQCFADRINERNAR